MIFSEADFKRKNSHPSQERVETAQNASSKKRLEQRLNQTKTISNVQEVALSGKSLSHNRSFTSR
jgi:hypothetical protein